MPNGTGVLLVLNALHSLHRFGLYPVGISKPSGASGGPSLPSHNDIAQKGKEFNRTISPDSLQRETATTLGTVKDKDIRFAIVEDMVSKAFDASSKRTAKQL